ncbi:periplasmic molybdate-binding protein, ModA2 [Azotobacter vinelandii CA]|uniref:Periplasmic molybdate-binding protein, ModA2 n=2 Tax=Azotobacter vinelandii TaxID=354 RepID=C1DGY8_AZOVD|nr:molybdate ABC transporter substrate-binding protein [Azotobacter vinelandii]ACO76395.1 periplasmic molybdate-binding protein, ModA2 [Azotobacter vinelandii DJ]AGK13722.1 periplasmic molybdate-binding protein, ModA2 [Azotobacter vinelandii CA]AGK18303.1 periplasmic molybdate-binding protein, ModA2 [Azotobacter vinelandii CA6]SFX76495.1 molybdate transport system substrate-binding protein [Azotobacter vinelandii]GLK58140.1 molybdate ABC transporter substrate-binding protein [Azotobacter vinel
MKRLLACLAIALALPFTAQANELKVVTATNFLGTLQQLAGEFEKETGHSITISSGSSGPVYAQIVNGAPYDVFFSADQKSPEKLDNEGFALPGSRFTYAIGKLVLWSAKPGLVDDQGKVLAGNGWRHIAISNPEIAPYGLAGTQVLTHLGLLDKLTAEKRIVKANSVGQAHSQTASGAADLGFVALAQIIQKDGSIPGSHWFPPADYYEPIVQQAVIVKSTREKALAEQFMSWMKGPRAVAIIKAAGYSLPE